MKKLWIAVALGTVASLAVAALASGAARDTYMVGAAGPVIAPLCGPCKAAQSGTATISKAVIAAIESGKAYVNVHTAKNAAGEIRGQVKASK